MKGSLYFQGNLIVTQQMQSILGAPLGSTSDLPSLTSFPSHTSLHKLFMGGKKHSYNPVFFGEKKRMHLLCRLTKLLKSKNDIILRFLFSNPLVILKYRHTSTCEWLFNLQFYVLVSVPNDFKKGSTSCHSMFLLFTF